MFDHLLTIINTWVILKIRPAFNVIKICVERERETCIPLSLSPSSFFISSLHLREMGLSKIVWLAWFEWKSWSAWHKTGAPQNSLFVTFVFSFISLGKPAWLVTCLLMFLLNIFIQYSIYPNLWGLGVSNRIDSLNLITIIFSKNKSIQ